VLRNVYWLELPADDNRLWRQETSAPRSIFVLPWAVLAGHGSGLRIAVKAKMGQAA
jgi:hypothetical protein